MDSEGLGAKSAIVAMAEQVILNADVGQIGALPIFVLPLYSYIRSPFIVFSSFSYMLFTPISSEPPAKQTVFVDTTS